MDQEMLEQWVSVEHNRLHCVERWPESPHKQAVLAAIHSALQGLAGGSALLCSICVGRKREAGILAFPRQASRSFDAANLAA
jgi:hypothetical protein